MSETQLAAAMVHMAPMDDGVAACSKVSHCHFNNMWAQREDRPGKFEPVLHTSRAYTAADEFACRP
jgi:hypothetical protein